MGTALSLLRKTRKELQYYRVSSFVGAQILAKEMCESLNVQADLKEKRLRKTKRQFSYESPDEQLRDSLMKLDVS